MEQEIVVTMVRFEREEEERKKERKKEETG
jgi:hypothetical protein